MADVIDDIKARLGIVEVVSMYVALKKAGRSYKGLCPFHNEKTPSFVVSPEKQICHCFGCNKGGDIFTFIQELEGLSFADSLKFLADKAGVKIDDSKISRNDNTKKEKDEYYRVNDLASEFFEKQLYSTNDGKKVLDYLYRRGLRDETIREFKLGFSPDKYDALYPFLLSKGISKAVLVKSGLVSSKNVVSDEIFDKFRGRLMFPIFDRMGKICGFGGRALKKDQMPKYLNSPENPIYNKGKVLYGFSHAKDAIKEAGKILLVEGYFDVILPYQAGIRYVVATSGTALTPDQAKLIKRSVSKAIACFDADDAGFEAGKRAYGLLRAEDIIVKTVPDLQGKDPADFVLADVEKFKALLEQEIDFIDALVDKLIKRNDITTFEGRLKIVRELLPYYKQFTPVERDHYVRQLAIKLGMDERSLHDEIENSSLPVDHPARKSDVGIYEKQRFSLEETVCSLLLEYPVLFENMSKILDESDFSGDMKRVYKLLTDQYNSSQGKMDAWDFESDQFKDLMEKVNILLLYAEERYGNFSETVLEEEVVKLIDRYKQERKTNELRDLQRMIEQAEKENDKQKLMQLLTTQQELLTKS